MTATVAADFPIKKTGYVLAMLGTKDLYIVVSLMGPIFHENYINFFSDWTCANFTGITMYREFPITSPWSNHGRVPSPRGWPQIFSMDLEGCKTSPGKVCESFVLFST